MAYMNQEKKKQIAVELKKVVPADWKYTVGVENHSTIVFNLMKAPVDFIGYENAKRKKMAERNKDLGYGNEYYPCNGNFQIYRCFSAKDTNYEFPAEVAEILEKISDCLNNGNYDKSDAMSDYFSVGWYTHINIGKWNKPFENTAELKEAA